MKSTKSELAEFTSSELRAQSYELREPRTVKAPSTVKEPSLQTKPVTVFSPTSKMLLETFAEVYC